MLDEHVIKTRIEPFHDSLTAAAGVDSHLLPIPDRKSFCFLLLRPVHKKKRIERDFFERRQDDRTRCLAASHDLFAHRFHNGHGRLVLGNIAPLPDRIVHIERTRTDLVPLAFLDIKRSGLPDVACLVMGKHFPAVGSRVHLEADPVFRVRPDLFIHDAGRLLGGQDQMDAKGAPDPCVLLQVVHDLRILQLQLGKFVHDDQQMAHGPRLAVLPDLRALARFLLERGQDMLALSDLALQRDHETIDLIFLQIGHLPCAMRKVVKRIAERAAFEIDEHILQIGGPKIHDTIQEHCAEKFRFPGTGHSGCQDMGAVQIDRDQLFVARSDHNIQIVLGLPYLFDLQIFAEHAVYVFLWRSSRSFKIAVK